MPTADDAHPLAKAIWSLLRDRSEADRRLVFDALQRRLEIKTTTAKQEQALAALRAWMEIEGSETAPSRRRYDAFRAAQPRPRDWPSATLVRNAFGGTWDAATAFAEGRPEANVLARRKISRGKKLSRELLEELLRSWIATVPEEESLHAAEFLSWCRQQVDDPQSKFELAPTTLHSICVIFGGWREALAAVGAIGRHPRQAPKRRLQGASPRLLKKALALDDLPRQGRIFELDDLVSWVRWAQSQFETDRAISEDDYRELRHRLTAELAERGETLRMPAPSTITRRFGSWPKSIAAAGLDDLTPPAHNIDRYTEEELFEALKQAEKAVEGRLTATAYERWRRRELERRRATEPWARLPASKVLLCRLIGRPGSWKEVLRWAEQYRQRIEGRDSDA